MNVPPSYVRSGSLVDSVVLQQQLLKHGSNQTAMRSTSPATERRPCLRTGSAGRRFEKHVLSGTSSIDAISFQGRQRLTSAAPADGNRKMVSSAHGYKVR